MGDSRLLAGLLALPLAGLVAGCGVRTDLKPALAHNLPVAPTGRPDRPATAELLMPGSVARPTNSVELRVRSEPRGDDPFDLPPKD